MTLVPVKCEVLGDHAASSLSSQNTDLLEYFICKSCVLKINAKKANIRKKQGKKLEECLKESKSKTNEISNR